MSFSVKTPRKSRETLPSPQLYASTERYKSPSNRSIKYAKYPQPACAECCGFFQSNNFGGMSVYLRTISFWYLWYICISPRDLYPPTHRERAVGLYDDSCHAMHTAKPIGRLCCISALRRIVAIYSGGFGGVCFLVIQCMPTA